MLVFSLISMHIKKKNQEVATGNHVNIMSLFPWFIVFFILMAILNSFGFIPPNIAATLKSISKFLMIAALASIGLSTDLNKMKKAGINPMIHGFIISALVVIVAISVEYFMGII